jgi:predicted NUDIX family NTP pyrophosphohydrolase
MLDAGCWILSAGDATSSLKHPTSSIQYLAMPKQSAGLLIYRRHGERLEVFLVHPGGPFWQNKDLGAWSIPKGEFTEGDNPLETAQRELHEETGLTVDGPFAPLDPIRQRGGKIVHAWIVEADVEPGEVKSNTFTVEWPRGSGKLRTFPEVDRAEWFSLEAATEKILTSQRPLLDQLQTTVGS